jgi:predicted kinase
MPPRPQLIIFSGLPGTGKSTLAKRLAIHLGAVYLRIDTIETALQNAGVPDVGALGYLAGYSIAKENLDLGNTVIADSVNPWQLTRDAWRKAATDAGKPSVDIEIICSDRQEHRRRVEQRPNDLRDGKPLTWLDVVDRDYLAWTDSRVQIDTAALTIDSALKN